MSVLYTPFVPVSNERYREIAAIQQEFKTYITG
jgi:hypothetical protein